MLYSSIKLTQRALLTILSCCTLSMIIWNRRSISDSHLSWLWFITLPLVDRSNYAFNQGTSNCTKSVVFFRQCSTEIWYTVRLRFNLNNQFIGAKKLNAFLTLLKNETRITISSKWQNDLSFTSLSLFHNRTVFNHTWRNIGRLAGNAHNL